MPALISFWWIFVRVVLRRWMVLSSVRCRMTVTCWWISILLCRSFDGYQRYFVPCADFLTVPFLCSPSARLCDAASKRCAKRSCIACSFFSQNWVAVTPNFTCVDNNTLILDSLAGNVFDGCHTISIKFPFLLRLRETTRQCSLRWQYPHLGPTCSQRAHLGPFQKITAHEYSAIE